MAIKLKTNDWQFQLNSKLKTNYDKRLSAH